MATLTLTNTTSSDIWLSDLYCNVPASSSMTVTRSASDLPKMASLQHQMALGYIKLSVAYSSDEAALVAPLTETAVASSALTSGAFLIRKSFAAAAAGTADDVTVYAVNTLPAKFRVVDAWARVATAIGGATVDVRTRAAGAGTLLATLDFAATGRVSMTVPNASAVATPGASDGLFLRRSDRGVAGEVFVLARVES